MMPRLAEIDGEELAGGFQTLPGPSGARQGAGDAEQERHAHPYMEGISHRHRKVDAAIAEEHGLPEQRDHLTRTRKASLISL